MTVNLYNMYCKIYIYIVYLVQKKPSSIKGLKTKDQEKKRVRSAKMYLKKICI